MSDVVQICRSVHSNTGNVFVHAISDGIKANIQVSLSIEMDKDTSFDIFQQKKKNKNNPNQNQNHHCT